VERVGRAGTRSTENSSSAESAAEGPCPICGGAGFLRVDVPPDHADFGKAIPCRCKLNERQNRRLQDLRAASNLGMLARMTFESFAPDGHGLNRLVRDNLRGAYEKAFKFAQKPEGWLILRGSYGCGKTHLAAAVANYQIAQGRPVLFAVVPDLLDHLRAAFGPGSNVSFDRRFEAVRTTPLLILDDLGTQSSTPWAQEKLYQVLNYRYNAQLPTLITTNRELEQLDARIRSRLVDVNWLGMVTILAPDYRGSGVEQSTLSSLGLHGEQTFGSFDLRSEDEALDAAQRANLRRAFDTASAFADNPRGWLVLTGAYGCGKTHLAAAIANHRIENGHQAIFVVVPDLLDHLRATFSPSSTVGFDRRFDEVRRAPLLVLDDLGTHSATPWAQEKLFQIFDLRYNADLPTVITMNKDASVDPRLTTRLFDAHRSSVWEITAPSYRQRAGRARSKGRARSARGRKGLGVSG
jgi:DNA replication protein DnaC